MSVVGQILTIVLWCYLLVLVFRLVMDYVFMFARSYEPRGVMVVFLEAAYSLTDPPLKFLRRFIPPLRLGGVALDLSFLVLWIIVYILIGVAGRL
ncbi:MAG: YggT family protein [Carbonactinosporaceae bacterium]